MSGRVGLWYMKHFDRERLLEELSKPVEGEFVVVKEGNMMTRVKKDELPHYIENLKVTGEMYLKRYEQCKKEFGNICAEAADKR